MSKLLQGHCTLTMAIPQIRIFPFHPGGLFWYSGHFCKNVIASTPNHHFFHCSLNDVSLSAMRHQFVVLFSFQFSVFWKLMFCQILPKPCTRCQMLCKFWKSFSYFWYFILSQADKNICELPVSSLVNILKSCHSTWTSSNKHNEVKKKIKQSC